MAENLLVDIECPRCNGAQKKMMVDPEDPQHVRTCPRCDYRFSPMTGGQLREGAITYPGEFPAPENVEAAPAPEAEPEPVTTEPEEEPAPRRRR